MNGWTSKPSRYGSLLHRISLIVVGLMLASCESPPTRNPSTLFATFHIATLHEKIFPESSLGVENPLIVNPEDRKIHLYGAGGETLYFQIVVPPGHREPLALSIGDFVHVDDGEVVVDAKGWRVFQMLTVPVVGYDAITARHEHPSMLIPREHPDPLAEISADQAGLFEVPMLTDRNTLLVVQRTLPKPLKEGRYEGQITLTDGKNVFSREATLHSWGVDLPVSNVNLFGVVDVARIWTTHQIGTLRRNDLLILPPDPLRTGQLADLVGEYSSLLDENGVEPWLERVYPRIRQAGTQAVAVEWEPYRRLMEAVLKNASAERKYWPVPMDLSYPSTRLFGPYRSDAYRQVLNEYLGQFYDRFLKAGLAGEGIANLLWVDDYADAINRHPQFLEMSHRIEQVEDSIHVVDPFIPIDLRPLGWSDFKPFDPSREKGGIICPIESRLDPEDVGELREKGTTILWRPTASGGGVSAVRVSHPRYMGRALAWTAWRYGTDGIVLTEVNQWGQPLQPAKFDESHDILVYPGFWFGQDKAVGSIRLKMMHIGLQDVAYLHMLERSGNKELADWLAERLVRFAHTEAYDGSIWSIRNDGLCNADNAWVLARLIAGYAVSREGTSVEAGEFDPVQIRYDTLVNRFKSLTEGVAVEVEGVRARNVLDLKTGHEMIEWRFQTAVRNFTKNVEGATLALHGRTEPSANVELTHLPWGWPVRSELRVQDAAAGLGIFGVNVQPITLSFENDKQVSIVARYAALAAGRLEKPVTIDGDFDDWPAGSASTAGDFLRIGSDGLNNRYPDPSFRSARWQTTVQTGYTSQHLYFAFTCHQPRQSLTVHPTNALAASGGLGWGEDYVAILFEPENAGSLNPMDVYHLIVKANGTVIAMRGPIDSQGASRVWAQNAQATVKVFDDRWQVELSVPLADLQGEDRLNQWWGMDFVRHSAAIAETSTWSGTAGLNCRPISLGNIFIAK